MIYLVIFEDKRSGVYTLAFTTETRAVECAKREAQALTRHVEDMHEEQAEGCLYYCRISNEGDCISVVEVELQD